MDEEQTRFEIVKMTGPDEASVELWDKTLAPEGLAFEAVEQGDGSVTVTGYRIPVPFAAFDAFLREVRSYLAPEA